MSTMFKGARAYEGQGIEVWDIGNVTTVFEMFMSANVDPSVVDNWDTSSVTNKEDFFGTFAPTSAPTPGPEEDDDDDDEGNVALAVGLSVLFFICVLAVVVAFRCTKTAEKKDASVTEGEMKPMAEESKSGPGAGDEEA